MHVMALQSLGRTSYHVVWYIVLRKHSLKFNSSWHARSNRVHAVLRSRSTLVSDICCQTVFSPLQDAHYSWSDMWL